MKTEQNIHFKTEYYLLHIQSLIFFNLNQKYSTLKPSLKNKLVTKHLNLGFFIFLLQEI